MEALYFLTQLLQGTKTMPLCNNCIPNRKAKAEFATLKLWCPTWITANNGPIHLCAECAKVFQPEHNPHNKGDGSYHWNEDADAMFKTVERFIKRDDPMFDNALGMLGDFKDSGPLFSTLVVQGNMLFAMKGEDTGRVKIVDGKVWIVNYNLISRLGDYYEVKARFPNLFKFGA